MAWLNASRKSIRSDRRTFARGVAHLALTNSKDRILYNVRTRIYLLLAYVSVLLTETGE